MLFRNQLRIRSQSPRSLPSLIHQSYPTNTHGDVQELSHQQLCRFAQVAARLPSRVFPHPSTAPPTMKAPLDCFWVTTLVMWESLTEILPPHRFGPTFTGHLFYIREFNFLRKWFFSSHGVIQRASAEEEEKIKAMALIAVGLIATNLVRFQDRCGIEDDDLRGSVMAKEYLKKEDVQAALRNALPGPVKGTEKDTYFEYAFELLWDITSYSEKLRNEKKKYWNPCMN